MKSKKAEELLDKIDEAIRNIEGFSNASSIELSYLAGYLLVLIAGIYEEAIETIVNEMVDRVHSLEISHFVEMSMKDSFRNPNIENVRKLIKKFSDDWEKEIIDLPVRTKLALTSIIADKTSLAHRGQIDATLKEVINYYNDSRNVIIKIDQLLL